MFQEEYYLNQSVENVCIPLPDRRADCLKKKNYLSEFKSEEDKAEARYNLGITSLLHELRNLILDRGRLLPWLEIDEDNYLVAWWADDGTIKDMGMDSDGSIWIIATDGNTIKESENEWYDMYSKYDRRVIVNTDLENEVCPVILDEGNECTVLYENISSEQDFSVSISPQYKTPDGKTLSIIVPMRGYSEVSYLKSGGDIFVRGA